MSTLKYTDEHEWVRVEGDTATVGISDYAQGQLGDVVYIELPEPGTTFDKGEEACVVESVKAASEVFAPVDCVVIEANGALTDAPETVNGDPTGKGWFMKVQITDPSQLDGLMDEDAYKKFVEGLD